MIANPDHLSAAEIAHSVAAGEMSALSATEAALARIARHIRSSIALPT
jgi:aspartyl-tRNA(Asn)/glutamyl-tRNA(Gln) amidotransferase subunit A